MNRSKRMPKISPEICIIAIASLLIILLWLNTDTTEGFQTPAVDPALACPMLLTQIQTFSENLAKRRVGSSMYTQTQLSLKSFCSNFSTAGCKDDVSAYC